VSSAPSPPDASPPAPRFAAFGYRDFGLYWGGQALGNVAAWMQIVATGWLVLELTDSPAYLGLNAALQALPIFVFSLFGGVIADRFDRHRWITWAQALAIVPDAALTVLVVTGLVRVEYVFAHSLISMTVQGLANPARHAFVAHLVPKEALLSAVALNGVLWHGSAVIGPMLAGLVTAAWGVAPNFYVNTVGQVVALVALLLIRVRVPPPPRATVSPWQSVVEGARYAWDHLPVRTVLLILTGVSLVGRSYPQIMPVFARDVYQVGPQGLGLLMTMPALGTVVAGFGLAALGKVPLARAFLLMVGVLGVALLLFAGAPSFWFALLPLIVVGATAQVATVIAQTMLQETVEDSMRGRVMSFFMSATWGANRVGALPIGFAAEAVGAPLAIGLSATLLLLALGPVARSRLLRA
jgi:MFS family permease